MRGQTTIMGLPLLMFVQYGHVLTGGSPQHALTAGSVQLRTWVSAARRNLKEA